MAEAINVKGSVIPKPDSNPPRPLAYHDRTLHILPPDLTPVPCTAGAVQNDAVL